MIQYFNDHPEVDRWSGEIELDGRPHMAHFNARRMKESCLRCHGIPENAPASLTKRYGSTAGFHRPVGEVIALDTVAIPMDKAQAAVMESALRNIILMTADVGVLVVVVALLFRFIVIRRLARMQTHCERIACQPNAATMQAVEVRGNDEITALARSFNHMVQRVRHTHASLEQRVKDQTSHLREAKGQADSNTQRAEQARMDMERLNAVMMGREQRVLEMKQEVNDLLAQLGEARKYENV